MTLSFHNMTDLMTDDVSLVISEVNDPHSNETTFKGKFSVGRRRFGERMGQTFGKEKKTDSEFDSKFKQVMELSRKVDRVRKAMIRQKEAILAMCKSAADIGNACADADVRDVQFQNSQYELDDVTRQALDASLSTAIDSLTSKYTGFKEMEKRVKIRQKLKLDYDHYIRKVSVNHVYHAFSIYISFNR